MADNQNPVPSNPEGSLEDMVKAIGLGGALYLLLRRHGRALWRRLRDVRQGTLADVGDWVSVKWRHNAVVATRKFLTRMLLLVWGLHLLKMYAVSKQTYGDKNHPIPEDFYADWLKALAVISIPAVLVILRYLPVRRVTAEQYEERSQTPVNHDTWVMNYGPSNRSPLSGLFIAFVTLLLGALVFYLPGDMLAASQGWFFARAKMIYFGFGPFVLGAVAFAILFAFGKVAGWGIGDVGGIMTAFANAMAKSLLAAGWPELTRDNIDQMLGKYSLRLREFGEWLGQFYKPIRMGAMAFALFSMVMPNYEAQLVVLAVILAAGSYDLLRTDTGLDITARRQKRIMINELIFNAALLICITVSSSARNVLQGMLLWFMGNDWILTIVSFVVALVLFVVLLVSWLKVRTGSKKAESGGKVQEVSAGAIVLQLATMAALLMVGGVAHAAYAKHTGRKSEIVINVPPPGDVTIREVRAYDPHELTISWKSAVGAVEYRIDSQEGMCPNGDLRWRKHVPATANEWTLHDLAGGTWCVCLRAVGPTGELSDKESCRQVMVRD